jgi:glycosyltransferase involved in cell wall biosynthesis
MSFTLGQAQEDLEAGYSIESTRASVVAHLKAPHDGYFVGCDAITYDLVQLGVDHGQVYDVKNAVGTERFHPERDPVKLDEIYRRQFDALDDSIRLGFVGGLQSYKGLDNLASALDEVETACQSSSLVTVPNGND